MAVWRNCICITCIFASQLCVTTSRTVLNIGEDCRSLGAEERLILLRGMLRVLFQEYDPRNQGNDLTTAVAKRGELLVQGGRASMSAFCKE